MKDITKQKREFEIMRGSDSKENEINQRKVQDDIKEDDRTILGKAGKTRKIQTKQAINNQEK